MKVPEIPVFFTKAPTSASGPHDPIPWDPIRDHSGRLRGRTGRHRRRRRQEHQARRGARPRLRLHGRQRRLRAGICSSATSSGSREKAWTVSVRWDRSSSLPTSLAILRAKRITLRVNGETRQDATTGDMIFPVNIILEYLSQGMTIEPGDIIATGTPEGVGLGRTPPEYLKDGDVVETEIEGIGMLRNRVVRKCAGLRRRQSSLELSPAITCQPRRSTPKPLTRTARGRAPRGASRDSCDGAQARDRLRA